MGKTPRIPRRSRRPVPSGEFEDPLSNYSAPRHDDALELSFCDDSVMVMKTAPFHAVPPDTTVEDVMHDMVKLDIACVLVIDGETLVGVVSERDVLMRISEKWETLRRQPISSVMTRDPVFIYDDDPPAKALKLMAVGGFRHIPILDVDNRVVGILGPRRILAYCERFM